MATLVAAWPVVTLSEVLRKSENRVELDPNREYAQITIRLWGKGVALRGRVAGAEIAASRQLAVRANQFILSRIDARNGALGLVPPELDGAVVSNDFPVFDLDASRLMPAFLAWMSKTEDFVRLCQQASEGTTNRVRLKEDRFLAMEIPLPPLDEQRRIVARIEELAARIKLARGLRRGAMAEAEALFERAVSTLPLSTSVWATVRTAVSKHKGAVRSGPFGSQLHHEEFVDTGIAAIGTRDVQVDRFTLTSGWYVTEDKFEQVKRYQVYPGDMLATIVGASIGRFCVVPDDVPAAFTTKHVLALTLDSSRVIPRFLSYILNFHDTSRASLFSQVEGSAQPSLNSSKVLDTVVPLPSLDEQRSLTSDLDRMHHAVSALEQVQMESAAELDALLPSILDKAFRGDL